MGHQHHHPGLARTRAQASASPASSARGYTHHRWKPGASAGLHLERNAGIPPTAPAAWVPAESSSAGLRFRLAFLGTIRKRSAPGPSAAPTRTPPETASPGSDLTVQVGSANLALRGFGHLPSRSIGRRAQRQPAVSHNNDGRLDPGDGAPVPHLLTAGEVIDRSATPGLCGASGALFLQENRGPPATAAALSASASPLHLPDQFDPAGLLCSCDRLQAQSPFLRAHVRQPYWPDAFASTEPRAGRAWSYELGQEGWPAGPRQGDWVLRARTTPSAGRRADGDGVPASSPPRSGGGGQ
jgi:hypothetical protein